MNDLRPAAGQPIKKRARQVLDYVRAAVAKSGRMPTYRQVSEDLGVPRCTIYRTIYTLAEQGYLVVHPVGTICATLHPEPKEATP